MSEVSVGVDPGKKGGIAAVFHDRSVRVWPMPLVASGKARQEYDLALIAEILRSFVDMSAFFTVERSQPIPPHIKAGSSAQFHRGVARGWEWALMALGLPYQLISPRRWQAEMFEGTPDNGDTKQRAAIAAQRLFPLVETRVSQRARKPHEGIVDALLIAEYGRRTQNGRTE